MIDGDVLIERFGDEEFLVELWTEARPEISEISQSVRKLLETTPLPEETGKLLHKFRGLISNFLTANVAIPRLKACEAAVQSKNVSEAQSHWGSFQENFSQETTELESWLQQKGHVLK